MSDQPKRGRKRLGDVIKIRASQDVRNYLEQVRVAQDLGDISAAGRMVLEEARLNRRFLPPGIDANFVLEPQP